MHLINNQYKFNIKQNYKYFIILFLLQSFSVSSQEKKIIEAYNLRFIDNVKSIEILKKIESESEFTNLEINFISNSFLSLTYLRQKKLDLAKDALEKAKKNVSKINSNNALGYYFFALSKYKNYIDQEGVEEDVLKALNYFEKSKNYSFATILSINLANSGKLIDKKTLDKVLKYAKLSNNNDVKLEALICESTYYKELYEKKSIPIQDVINSFEKLINQTKIPTKNKMNLAIAYLNYASFLVVNKPEDPKILSLTNTALAYAEKYKILSVVRNCYGVKGLLYKNKEKYIDAEKSFLKGLDYLKTLPFKNYDTEKVFYSNLKEIAALKKDFYAYYSYDLLFQEVSNLDDENKREEIIQNVNAKYDLQTKKDKIEALSRVNNLKDGLVISSFIALFLGIGFFFFYRKSTIIKQVYLEQKKNKLQKEKEQTQKELMNSILHIEKKNEILKELKYNLLDQNKEQNVINKNVFKTIEAGLAVDDDFEKFKNNFNTIYPDFFERLQQKANNTLTQLDLKYCGYILMNVTTKEIASQMNVEPKSIRMARYRIKQKLQLLKEDDLNTFIQDVK